MQAQGIMSQSNGSAETLQVFMSSFEQFLEIERQSLQQALSSDVLDNLVLYHRTSRQVKLLQDFCQKIVELSKQV